VRLTRLGLRAKGESIDVMHHELATAHDGLLAGLASEPNGVVTEEIYEHDGARWRGAERIRLNFRDVAAPPIARRGGVGQKPAILRSFASDGSDVSQRFGKDSSALCIRNDERAAFAALSQ
jgi:hypothetical protein